MAGIDNNTVLYLRGDEFKDLSPSPKVVTNANGEIFNNSLYYKGSGQYSVITGFDFTPILAADHTIEFDYYQISRPGTAPTAFCLANGHATDGTSSRAVYMHSISDTEINFYYGNETSTPPEFKVSGMLDNTWYHIAIVRSGAKYNYFINGELKGSMDITNMHTAANTLHLGLLWYNSGYDSVTYFNGYIKNFRISNIARYTENFTPQTGVYSSVSIDDVTVENNILQFKVNKLSPNERINKVELLLNDSVSQTYTDNYDNLTFDFNRYHGKFDIEIRAYYFNDNYVQYNLEYGEDIVKPERLEETAGLSQLISRMQEVNLFNKEILDIISDILITNGVNIFEEDKKISTLAFKLEEFTNNLKNNLVNILHEKNIDCNISNSFNELLMKVDELSLNPFFDWVKADTWLTSGICTPFGTGSYHTSASAHQGKVYVIGGYNSKNSLGIYDVKTNSWSIGANTLTAVYGHDSTVVDNKIYCIGGYNNLTTNQVYNINNNSWTSLKALPTGREYLTVDAVNNSIYAIGGLGATTYLNTNECYDVITDTWTTKTVMPQSKYDHSSTVIDNDIYCIGGYTGSLVNTNYKYNTSTDTWTTMTAVTAGRRRATCDAWKGKIYYTHGSNASTTYYKTNYCYDPITNAWTALTGSPRTAFGRSSAIVNGLLFAFGGYSGSALAYVDCYII